MTLRYYAQHKIEFTNVDNIDTESDEDTKQAEGKLQSTTGKN